MTKFLVIIALLITGLEYASTHCYFNSSSYDLAKLYALQDEENKLEKEEDGKCKQNFEDKIFLHSISNALFKNLMNVPKLAWQKHRYIRDISNSNTPPPEVL